MRHLQALLVAGLFSVVVGDVLQGWLQDPLALQALQERQALLAALGGPAHPLGPALNATPALALPSRACLAHVREMLQSRATWALKMADASVKVPVGVLTLHTTHFGNWDECVNIADEDLDLQGKMCLVKISIGTSTSASQDIPVPITGGGLASTLGMLSLKLGTCVPSSCSSADVAVLYSALLNQLPVSSIQFKASVAESDCTTKETPALDASDWVAVGILCVLGALLVLSTAYDLLTPGPKKKALLAAFSVVANGRKLLAAPRVGGDQTLSCLHGLRVISMCWVVLCHRYELLSYVPSQNVMFVLKFLSEWYRVGISNGTLSVDTFFVLSGLLVGYLFFKQAPSKRTLNIPMYYIHRYIRLTPALALMILLSASLVFHAGWGPIWTSAMSSGRDDCRKYWWSLLLYVDNYVNPTSKCMDQSWYLMVDMQLYWLSPLLLIPMARWPRAGKVLLSCLIVGGLVSNFTQSYVEEFPVIVWAVNDEYLEERYWYYYYNRAYSRFVAYVLGLAVGYILADRKVRGKQPVRYDFLTLILAWLSAAALLLVPLMTGYEFIMPPFPSVWLRSLFNSIFRPIWALGVASVVYLCASGHGGPVNTFLSWSGFQILGRFSYGVYLVHVAVLTTKVASAKTAVHLSDGVALAEYASDLLICYLFAGVLSVVCESPFLVIEKELFGGSRAKALDSIPAPTRADILEPAPATNDNLVNVASSDDNLVPPPTPDDTLVHRSSDTPVPSSSDILVTPTSTATSESVDSAPFTKSTDFPSEPLPSATISSSSTSNASPT